LTSRWSDAQNESTGLRISELGLGGCLLECFPEARDSYEFRLEIPLVEEGWLQHDCKVKYRFTTVGLGIEFLDTSEVAKESLIEIIMSDLWREDLPLDAPHAPAILIDDQRKLEFA
jgi:hypothetical protein